MSDSKAKTKTNKKPRLFVNWKIIYPLYKLGTLKNIEIINQYESDMINSQIFKRTLTEGALRKQAIKLGWQRDLSRAVSRKIKDNLVREAVRKKEISNQQTDESIIEGAAKTGTQVVLRHRKQIDNLEQIEDWLLNELSNCPKQVHVSNYKGFITETVLNVGIKDLTSSYKSLVSSMKNRIALEREAFCIGAEEEGEKDRPKVIQVILED